MCFLYTYAFVYILFYPSLHLLPMLPVTALSPQQIIPSSPYDLLLLSTIHTICYYYLPSIHSTALYKAYKISYTRLIKQKCPLTIACMQTPLSLLAQNEGKEIRETDGLLSAGIYISLLLRRFLCETEVRSLIPSRSGAYKTTPVFQTRPSHS